MSRTGLLRFDHKKLHNKGMNKAARRQTRKIDRRPWRATVANRTTQKSQKSSPKAEIPEILQSRRSIAPPARAEPLSSQFSVTQEKISKLLGKITVIIRVVFACFVVDWMESARSDCCGIYLGLTDVEFDFLVT